MDHEVRSLRPSRSTWWNPVSSENTKISWPWWYVLVIPASREAEAGKLCEPGRRRLQWAEIAPLHSSPGDSARLRLKKQTNTHTHTHTHTHTQIHICICIFFFKVYSFLFLFIYLFLKTGFHHVGQAGLELSTSGDLPAFASKVLGLQTWDTAPGLKITFFILTFFLLVS